MAPIQLIKLLALQENYYRACGFYRLWLIRQLKCGLAALGYTILSSLVYVLIDLHIARHGKGIELLKLLIVIFASTRKK